MPEVSSIQAFVAAALVVLVIPGPGVLYILARSLGQGQKAGVVSAAGLSLGACVHVVGATVGLSALLLASATALSVVKLLGAGYLIYLGVRAIRSARQTRRIAAPEDRSSGRLFRDGIVVSVLNPKIAVFFLAFLPQFVDASRGSIPAQVLFLGTLYAVLAFVTDSTYALLAARIRDRLGDRLAQSPMPGYASGAVYIGLGVGTAFADQR